MRAGYKTIGLWVVLIALFVAFYQVFQHTDGEVDEVSATQFDQLVADGRVTHVDAKPRDGIVAVWGRDAKSGEKWRTNADMERVLRWEDHGVDVSLRKPEENSVWLSILSQWMPVVFLFLFFIFFTRQMQGKGVQMPVLKLESQAFADPGALRGLDAPRQRLKNAALSVKDGSPGPRRVLISGPPGTGKTSLVKAVCADSGLRCISVPSSELVDTFVGTGAKRVRQIFDEAKGKAPVIVVMEDVDGVGKLRTPTAPEKAQDEREQTLVELCQWLDGLKNIPDKVLFVATTNRLDLLDPAFVRPGRFQLHVKLGPEGATVEG